jgi:hypothetical protein
VRVLKRDAIAAAKDVLPEEHVRLRRMLLGLIEIDDAPITEARAAAALAGRPELTKDRPSSSGHLLTRTAPRYLQSSLLTPSQP